MSRTDAVIVLLVALLAGVCAPSAEAQKSSSAATKLSSESLAALDKLCASVPAAKALGARAVAILVFPTITKAGFMVGGQKGEGALFRNGKAAAYYRSSGGSYGLQAGVQKFGYALFFMTEKAVVDLDRANGLELGIGPSFVMVDDGMAKQTTTTTMSADVYAFVFGQKGLMGGLGLQGNRIARFEPK